jgi:hypothetical protein
VNGSPYGKTFLPHSLLTDGAVLDFDMGPRPSAWGTGVDALPPSLTSGNQVPRPPRDVSATGHVSGGSDITPLLDDNSRTETGVSWLQYQTVRPSDIVSFYTVTSGATPGADPSRWQLKGSFDGKTWTVLDDRPAETFAWRQQTRAFKVDRPGRYTFYRLELAAAVTVAEVELLAAPRPACTQTITGRHDGALRVRSGILCLDGATVTGPVHVESGAELDAFGGSITGPVSTTGAGAVVLTGTRVSGPVSIRATAGEVSVGGASITGPVSLVDNLGGQPALIASSTIDGPLSCTGNTPAPVNNDLPNAGRGPRSGQCARL